MTLPASGSISLTDIATEFSATLPKSLTDFYRGGTYVPNTTVNAAIPTSGTISITNFYGASAATSITISSAWTNVSGASPRLTALRTLTVPSGNPGGVTHLFSIISGTPTFEYSDPILGFTGFTSGTVASYANGDSVRIRMTGAASSATVTIKDYTTGDTIATCTLTNT